MAIGEQPARTDRLAGVRFGHGMAAARVEAIPLERFRHALFAHEHLVAYRAQPLALRVPGGFANRVVAAIGTGGHGASL